MEAKIHGWCVYVCACARVLACIIFGVLLHFVPSIIFFILRIELLIALTDNGKDISYCEHFGKATLYSSICLFLSFSNY